MEVMTHCNKYISQSTKITLGDGNKALFWQDNWSGQGRLRDVGPDLYKIASRKKRLVAKELHDDN
jgi:hypothetical protein